MTDRRAATQRERSEMSSAYAGYQGGYARRWSLANFGNRAIIEERDRLARRVLAQSGLSENLAGVVLDVGAGSGESFPGLVTSSAQNLRVDLLEERLRLGLAADPTAALVCADGAQLPIRSGTIDLVVLSTVLSSVRDRVLQVAILADAWRVLRSGGGVLVYEFRVGNPRNPHTSPLRRAALVNMLPTAPSRMRSLTVAPPIARRLGRTASWSYPLLGQLPLLRTHNMVTWVKP